MMVRVRGILVAIQLEHAAPAPVEHPGAFVRLAVPVLDAEAYHGSPAIAAVVHAEANVVSAEFVGCEVDAQELVAVFGFVVEEAAVAEEFAQVWAVLEVQALEREHQHQACRVSLDSACQYPEQLAGWVWTVLASWLRLPPGSSSSYRQNYLVAYAALPASCPLACPILKHLLPASGCTLALDMPHNQSSSISQIGYTAKVVLHGVELAPLADPL
jgi:hypothetical protein